MDIGARVEKVKSYMGTGFSAEEPAGMIPRFAIIAVTTITNNAVPKFLSHVFLTRISEMTITRHRIAVMVSWFDVIN
jgi:hypothetical protein